MSEIEKVLGTVKEAIEIERFGYDFYNSMREFVKDSNGQKLVSHLAKLEVDHIKWLEEEYQRQLEKLDELHDEGQAKISLLGKEKIFLAQDKLPDIFREFDPIKALNYAIGIENRSVDFYEKNMAITEDDKTKELFRRLADFERDHIDILEENLKNLKKLGQWRGSSIKKGQQSR